MMMMENGAEFVNGHYQLPLPLSNPVLKRRFNKNKKIFED